MSNHNTLSALFCFSLLSIGCGEIPEASELQQNMTVVTLGASGSQKADVDSAQKDNRDPANYGCHPLSGSTWVTEIPMTAYPTYSQRDTWCSVGKVPGLPAGCYYGRWVVYQDIKPTPTCLVPAGSCYLPNAIWEVTCKTLVECRYNCDGECVPTACP